jgi:hypothetical protein
MSTPIRILVENRGEELIARGIFADLCRDGRVDVVMCWVASSVVTIAQSSLLRNPEQPIAAILNCPAGNDPAEFREPVVRVLSRVASNDVFHVALAIPEMTAWAKADRRFAAENKASTTPPSNSRNGRRHMRLTRRHWSVKALNSAIYLTFSIIDYNSPASRRL